MSVQFAADGSSHVGRISSFDYNAAYTVLGWHYLASIGSNQTLFEVWTGGNDWDRYYATASFVTNRPYFGSRYATNDEQMAPASAFTPSAGVWYPFALVRNSVSQITIYTGTTAANIAADGGSSAGSVSGRTAGGAARYCTRR